MNTQNKIIGIITEIEEVNFHNSVSTSLTYTIYLQEMEILVYDITYMNGVSVGDMVEIPVSIEVFNSRLKMKCIDKIEQLLS
jgi:hypothetical protein